MTVQELINTLNAIEDKTLLVRMEKDMGAREVTNAEVVTERPHWRKPPETYVSLYG